MTTTTEPAAPPVTDPEVVLISTIWGELEQFGPKGKLEVAQVLDRVVEVLHAADADQAGRAVAWALNRAEMEHEAAMASRQRKVNTAAVGDIIPPLDEHAPGVDPAEPAPEVNDAATAARDLAPKGRKVAETQQHP